MRMKKVPLVKRLQSWGSLMRRKEAMIDSEMSLSKPGLEK
jgi:hypothetical protein